MPLRRLAISYLCERLYSASEHRSRDFLLALTLTDPKRPGCTLNLADRIKTTMKDPYAFGFYCALFALAAMTGAVFYESYSGAGDSGSAAAFSVINSCSSLVQALAAIGLVGLAFKAYRAWKNEIIHNKALSIIWEANVAFREIELSFNEWFFGPNAVEKANSEGARITSLLAASPFGASLRSFKKQCILIDKVVIKDDWQWVNHATELDMLARVLSMDAFRPTTKAKETANIIDFLYSREGEALKRTQSEWEMLMKVIEKDLAALEAQYSA